MEDGSRESPEGSTGPPNTASGGDTEERMDVDDTQLVQEGASNSLQQEADQVNDTAPKVDSSPVGKGILSSSELSDLDPES